MIPGTVILVRHAKASGQVPTAPLTPEGVAQAANLAERLGSLKITRIVSSPWVRAFDTISPLSERLNVPVQTDERLTERVLSRRDLLFWQTALKASFAMPNLTFPGGESGRQAQTRALSALEAARDPAGMAVLVTHGNLLALLLGLGFDGWAGLENPDVWVWEPGQSPRRLETP